MTERRSPVDIYADILTAISKERYIKTHIVYKTNLNFVTLDRYMRGLVRNELVKIQSNSPTTWVITRQGREFLTKHEELRKLLAKGEEG